MRDSDVYLILRYLAVTSLEELGGLFRRHIGDIKSGIMSRVWVMRMTGREENMFG